MLWKPQIAGIFSIKNKNSSVRLSRILLLWQLYDNSFIPHDLILTGKQHDNKMKTIK